MNSITQDMKYRQSLLTYAQKYGVSRASRKYNKSRSYIYFWKTRWDGTVQSLACPSRRPHSHPNQHTEADLKQAAAIEEDRHERKQAGQYEQDAHVGGRLRHRPVEALQREGVEAELAHLPRKPGQRGENRYGHQGRQNQQIEGLDALYHFNSAFDRSNTCCGPTNCG